MNKLQRIEEMEKQLAALRQEVEQESKAEKWEPRGGEFYVTADGCAEQGPGMDEYRLFGTERQTREAAERARDKIRMFNRLLAYVDEFAPDWNGENPHYIYADDGVYKWSFASLGYLCMPMMSKSVAEELCRKLNSGEVIL